MDRVGHVELGRQQRVELMYVLAVAHDAFTMRNVKIASHFIHLNEYVYECMFVCMYVCTYVCTYVCMTNF